MPILDAYGNRLSTSQAKARDYYDKGVFLFLGGNHGASDAFSISCASDPTFCLGHAAYARALMMEGRMHEARKALDRAKTLMGSASNRERAHVTAYVALFKGEVAECANIVRSHAAEFPRDPMIIQLLTNVFGLIGFSGKVGREADLLAFTNGLMPHCGDDWWMMSMHAMSLCETGQLSAAMSHLDRSLNLNPKNAHAAHCKAHVLYETGESKEGRQFLDDWADTHDTRGVLQGHLTWHRALWALNAGDEAAMWKVIDNGVWPNTSSSLPINILTDSASILFRAEMAGVSVPGDRWRTISSYAAKYFPETGQSFADVHSALCHAMAGEEDKLAKITERAQGFAGDIVRPLSAAWGHIARQNWAEALRSLSGVMATHERLGGSRAQRDLIELTYANVLMKLGRPDEARRSLLTRRPVLNDGNFIEDPELAEF